MGQKLQNSCEKIEKQTPTPLSEIFGMHVFNRAVMERMLPRDVYLNVSRAMDEKESIKPEYADMIASAMKEWAISHGATHFTHWFQPLTGACAEKHDAFIDWSAGQVIERLSVHQLLQGEPDASSFPSGGLRTTFEARGYTGWDPTSPPFIWTSGKQKTLCIPSVFFSWAGHPLDSKIPLLRSDKKVNDAILRLLRYCHVPADHIFTTIGLEQEYFVIDRDLRNARPDLLLNGRTVFGAAPAKGQELQDHYLGAVKPRILAFMGDFETAALKLGIPVKTRHNEVAPAQHEIAVSFERASLAIDHNLLLMELMRQIASNHNLSCLLHDKPFQGLNGSGKHCNWSFCTDHGLNLLDPKEMPGKNMHFPILVTAILHAVHRHGLLLRASIGSGANDYRLGGHEAPPVIMSVYLGEELEEMFKELAERGKPRKLSDHGHYDLGLPHFLPVRKDNTDRNRTSPFAFTGTKFEFRALGGSSHPAFPVTVLNAIVAESLNEIMDELEAKKGKGGVADRWEASVPVLSKYLKRSADIRFGGDNYSKEWAKEAKRRGLPIADKSIYAIEALRQNSTEEAFRGILTKEELQSRFDVFLESYSSICNIEAALALDLFYSHVLPAATAQQKLWAETVQSSKAVLSKVSLNKQLKLLEELVKNIEGALEAANALSQSQEKASNLKLVEKSRAYCEKVLPACEKLRTLVDRIETQVDHKLWTLPKYRELLFLV